MQALDLAQANDFLNSRLPSLLARLRPDLLPLWGMMSPQHAVEHLTRTVQASNNSQPFPVMTPDEKLPKMRMFLTHNVAIAPNFKSPIMDSEQLSALRHDDLENAIEEFWREWAAFEAFFKNEPEAVTANAVFGYLTEEEWRKFHFKHFVHHLAQFGLTTNETEGLEAFVPRSA